jgi:hypothetical protein
MVCLFLIPQGNLILKDHGIIVVLSQVPFRLGSTV